MSARRQWLPAVLVASLALLVADPVAGQRTDEIFTRANTDFFEGRYDDAIARYRTLVEAGIDDGAVYYNLASAHTRRGELGHAVLYFERALVASGGDDDTRAALRVVRELLGKRAAERDGEAIVQTRPPLVEAVVEPFSENTLAWTLVITLWLLFGLLMLRRSGLLPQARVVLGAAAALAGVLVLLASAALAVRTGALHEGQRAVVLEARGGLREGPDERAGTRAPLIEGGLARAIQQEGRWVRIRTDQGHDGWVSADLIGLIDPQLTGGSGETRIGPP